MEGRRGSIPLPCGSSAEVGIVLGNVDAAESPCLVLGCDDPTDDEVLGADDPKRGQPDLKRFRS